MKNRKREVVERLVPFNRGELEFLRRLVQECWEGMSVRPGYAARPMVERVREKLDRAERVR